MITKEQKDLQRRAELAAKNHRKLAEDSAHAIMQSPSSTFAERTRARIILKRIKKNQPLTHGKDR